MAVEIDHGGRASHALGSPELACLAALSLSAALAISRGLFHPVALGLVTLAAALSVLAIWRREKFGDHPTGRALQLTLTAALVASCGWHVFDAPGWVAARPPTVFRALAIATLLVALSYSRSIPPKLARWRFALLATCFVSMASAVVAASPFPHIDVWWCQQLGASAFLRGENPYSITYPNVYAHTLFYGPGMIENGRVVVFPYLPLTFLLEAPGVAALGDARLVLILLTVAAAVLLRRTLQNEIGELAALLLLLQPRTFFVLQQSWTEPLVLFCFTLALFALRRAERNGRWVAAGIAGGLLAVSKQYAPLFIIPLVATVPPRFRWKWCSAALLMAAAILAPFVLWDAREFWRDIVVAQVRQPFRMDALSWLVPVAAAIGRPVSAVWGFAAATLALAASSRRPPSAARAACVGGTALLLFVLFNKQAFCNYYWLCSAVLLCGGALWSASEASRPAQVGEPEAALQIPAAG